MSGIENEQNTEFEKIKWRHECMQQMRELCTEIYYDDAFEDAHADRADLIALVESERARADTAEAKMEKLRDELTEPDDIAWTKETVGWEGLHGPALFERLVAFAEERMATDPERKMTIRLKLFKEMANFVAIGMRNYENEKSIGKSND